MRTGLKEISKMVIGLGPIYRLPRAMQTDKQGAKSIVPEFPLALNGPWALRSGDQRRKVF